MARFMGILELIKQRRISITSIKVIEDVVEYEESGLNMTFILNPDYIPPENNVSEFDVGDSDDEKENEEK